MYNLLTEFYSNENNTSFFLINCSNEKCNSLAFDSVWLILLLKYYYYNYIFSFSILLASIGNFLRWYNSQCIQVFGEIR